MSKDIFLRNSYLENEHELLTPISKTIVEIQLGESLALTLLPLSVLSTLVEVADNSSTSPTYLSLTPYATLARS
jgi:hypothetical protein